jgi:general secretion pathway protein G
MKSVTVKKWQKSKAFTITEFAASVMIASLFYMTISPAIYHSIEQAESATTSNEVDDMQTTIDDFFRDNGRFPDSLDEIFEEIPLDPWGNPYKYTNILNSGGLGKLRKDKNLVPINSDYDLYSMGPDGKTASALTAAISQDDIVRGRNGLFVGLATDY